MGCSLTSYPQSAKKNIKLFEKANAAYSSEKVDEAINLSNQIIKNDSSFTNAYLFLADIYSNLDSIQLEIKYLEHSLNYDTGHEALINFKIGEAYLSLGKYQKALWAYGAFQKYPKKISKREAYIQEKVNQCNFALQELREPKSTNVKALEGNVNTHLDEYWPSQTIDGKQLVFTRLVPDSVRRWQEDFYLAESENGIWTNVAALNEINTPENEGAQSLSADGKLLFFTACNQAGGFGSCDIYVSVKNDKGWQKPVNAGTKLNTYKWESQPSISSNSEYLYFTSNREGGFGGKDIWRIKIKGFMDNGLPIWGHSENLGDSINTTGEEVSPNIHFSNKTLYFSSDKWLGMGKSDIFFSTLNDDNQWSTPVNLGYPINTHNDEQGFFVDATAEKAYFSSSRNKNKGLDIFTCNLNTLFQPKQVTYLRGSIINAETNQPLEGTIDVMDMDNNSLFIDAKKSDGKGEFFLCLPLGTNYAFNVSKDGYLFFSESIDLNMAYSSVYPFEYIIGLQPVKVGEKLVLKNINFETNSYEILENSFSELNKLYLLLKDNPNIKIEIGGHTDNVGSEGYNQELSEKRAEQVSKYLVSSGIKKERLLWKGYGYTKPLDSNDTMEGRKLNRRTEITILE